MSSFLASVPWIGNMLQQCVWIPTPSLTEANLPSQSGKVHIVTGGYSGVGLELAKILYGAGATVYIAGRTKSKYDSAVSSIKKAHPSSQGRLEYMHIDLSDLPTIKPAAEAFLAKESRLDVLTNNAGVMMPPPDSKTEQNHDLQIGTNCLGPYLLTKFLTPLMDKTASSSPEGSVRVTWAGSLAIDAMSPPGGGMAIPTSSAGPQTQGKSQQTNYGQSKAGNLFLASESARRYTGSSGVLHVCWNPGNLRSDLSRHMPAFTKALSLFLCYPAVYGAYTELYAGWSKDITPALSGCFIMPWGRLGDFRADVAGSLRGGEEGGSGLAARFWDWCDKETKEFS